MNHKRKNMPKNLLVLLNILLLSMLVACNLAPVSSLSQPTIDIETVVPSFPTPTSNRLPFSAPVVDNIRTIFARGQMLGNQPNVFAKVGDSITVSRHFLTGFGIGTYNLGSYSELQPVIDFYSQIRARDSNSFANTSLAAGEGWAAWAVLDNEMADEICAGYSPLECEYNYLRPSLAIIMYGTNDVGYRSEADYYADLTRIVQISANKGIVPILSTIPNRPDEAERTLRFNAIVQQIAEENALPIMDFYGATIDLPNFGLTFDNVHPSAPAYEAGGAFAFTSQNLQYGYTQRNLLALEILHAMMQVLDLP
jgi:hypothetical protein